jgi:chromate transport protein ChrA
MQRDLVEERRWISREDYMDGLALSQLAPGPLAAQLAIYLGYVRGGALGATVVAVLFVLPSFLMVWAISVAYVRFGGPMDAGRLLRRSKWKISELWLIAAAAVLGVLVRT